MLTPEELAQLARKQGVGRRAFFTQYTPQQQAAVVVDRVAQAKETYERYGTDRSDLAYGYVAKRPS